MPAQTEMARQSRNGRKAMRPTIKRTMLTDSATVNQSLGKGTSSVTATGGLEICFTASSSMKVATAATTEAR